MGERAGEDERKGAEGKDTVMRGTRQRGRRERETGCE